MAGELGLIAAVDHQEGTGAEGALGLAGLQATLAEGGGLLIAKHRRDRHTGKGQAGSDHGEGIGAGPQLRQQRHRHPEGLAELGVPAAGPQIHQQGAAGIAAVGGVALTSAELPEQPAVHRAEGQATTGGRRLVIAFPQQPEQLAGGKVGISQQAGAVADQRFEAAGFPRGAEGSGAAVLPDDRQPLGDAIGAAPEQGGFALVGDAAGGHRPPLLGADRRLQGRHRLQLALPDRGRILLHPAIGRIAGLQGGAAAAQAPAAGVVEGGARAGGALIEAEQQRVRHPSSAAALVPC